MYEIPSIIASGTRQRRIKSRLTANEVVALSIGIPSFEKVYPDPASPKWWVSRHNILFSRTRSSTSADCVLIDQSISQIKAIKD
jgi:hypothetical protein